MTASSVPGDLRRYDEIVRGLHAFLNEAGPPADFEQRLARRLDHEWTQLTARRAERRASTGWNRPALRVLAGAAAAVFVIAFILLLPRETNLTGTAIGEFGTGFLTGAAIVAVLAAILFIIIWRRR
ncbi:MAG: hypothetical protein ACUVS2_02370 [Candidatus Flexifilum sp.]